MSRFKRLTDTKARCREFSRILRSHLSPASIAEAMQDMIDHIERR